MECLHLLLAAGADINLRVQNGSLDLSPLEMAIRWDDHGDLRRVFPVLLRAGAAIPVCRNCPRRSFCVLDNSCTTVDFSPVEG